MAINSSEENLKIRLAFHLEEIIEWWRQFQIYINEDNLGINKWEVYITKVPCFVEQKRFSYSFNLMTPSTKRDVFNKLIEILPKEAIIENERNGFWLTLIYNPLE